MEKAWMFSPPQGPPAQDGWLDRLSYARLLSIAGSLVFAVKSPDAELRKVLQQARLVPRKERRSERAKAAREALLSAVRQYLQEQRLLDPTRVPDIARPHGQGIPAFTKYGTLPPGYWQVTLVELSAKLAFNQHRRAQLKGLFKALTMLKAAGCKKVTIAGSFASRKPKPSDIDMVWDEDGLDKDKLDPIFSEASSLERQRLLGIDSTSEEWKMKLSIVQSLWMGETPQPHECSKDELADLPHFRAVGVLVVDLTQEIPALSF